MLRNKFIILFFVLVFSIGLVSAEEINDIEDSFDVYNDDLEINGDEVKTYSVAGNFTWLEQKIISEDVVDLEGKTVLWNDTGKYSDGISINKTVTIRNGVIDGDGQVRIFNIVSSGNLILENITLQNGYESYGGGAIYNTGSATINNSTLNNNNATHGGAIRNNGGSVTISNSTLNNNIVSGGGGAIYNDDGNVTISNSTLNNNTSSSGGAIRNNGGFSISNSTLNNNKATHGGAIYNAYGNSFSISNSTLNNNKASYGGAIHNSGSGFSISNSAFNNNTVNSYGGAIYNDYGNGFTINNSTLNNNNATHGGAIHNERGNSFSISNSTLNNNNAYNGGTIYNYYGNSFSISNSTLNNNNAYNGGTIYNEQSNTFTISNSTLNNNNATHGGAIRNQRSSFSISNSTLNNNNASNVGGAIHNEQSNTFTINNSTLNNNKATHGGAIHNNDGSSFSISNSTLNNNKATHGGAIYNEYRSSFSISNSTLNNNNASSVGGAIYNDDVFSVISCNLTNNYVDISGSVIYNTGNFILSNSLLNNSKDVNHLIYNDKGAILSLKNNTMLNNYSEQIYNNGTINSRVYLIILGNDTYYSIYGDDILLNASLTDDNDNVIVGQNITLFNNIVLNINLTSFKDGLYTKNLTSPNSGEYLVNGTYIGGNNVTVQTGLLVIDKINATFNLNESNMIYGANQTIKITTNISGVTGNITIYYNGKNQTKNITNDEVIFTNLNLPAGDNIITVFYSGDEKYHFKTFNTTVSVLRSNKTDINVTNPDIVSSENQTITVTVAPNATGNATLTINNKNYTSKIINGTVNFNVTDLNPDNYTAVITYPGDNNYNSFNKTLNITIAKTDVLLDANDTFLFYRNGTQYVAVLKDSNNNPIAGMLVQITINGVTYNRTTNSDGKVFLNINLDPNTYNVTATFNGSSKYFNKSITNLVVVNSTLIAEDLSKHFRNESQYSVEVLDKQGKPINNTVVEFNINGVLYNRTTNDKGIATLNINLDPNTYIITVKYNDLEISNIIKVLPILIGKDLNKTFGDKDTYNVEVLDDQGNKVINQTIQININGVIYNRTSDDNGIVKLNINLNPGSYIATASWKNFHTSNIITVNK
ncbi:beta strand repeat-containing protein [Methanobrevibacter sp. DSM 116169]|uniref:beta strand repeat-containing protein n=1 Tax=Methanobrevibacter sp. DSM 116169 TaxID=3242727 RepID=UPI0038FC60BA